MTANQLEFISLRRIKYKTNTILHGVIYLFIFQLVILFCHLKYGTFYNVIYVCHTRLRLDTLFSYFVKPYA